jgi:hypothetical protein
VQQASGALPIKRRNYDQHNFDGLVPAIAAKQSVTLRPLKQRDGENAMAKSTAPKTELSTEIKSFHQGSQPQVPTNFGTTKPTPIVMTVDWKSALKAGIEMLKAGQQIYSGTKPVEIQEQVDE